MARQMMKEIAQRIVALLMFACVMGGLILMMCECEDMKKQTMVLFGGLGLFLLGVLPRLFIAGKDYFDGNKD